MSQIQNVFSTGKDDCAPALFGDSFGAVNALISALAFAGMIVTFILQRYELEMQRKELKAQRLEFSSQNKTLKLQRFENTFFNMMELQQSIVNDLYVMDSYKDNVIEDNPIDYGRYTKEVVVSNEYRGRNMFSMHSMYANIILEKISLKALMLMAYVAFFKKKVKTHLMITIQLLFLIITSDIFIQF